MKFIRTLLFALFFTPVVSYAASDFTVAAQLLAAAKNADIQQVQVLVNNGANVNFVDGTGLSIVCTALMNNDIRAAQILQMYGADASNCDRQIRQYNSRNKPKGSGGLFGGLSSAQSITLAAAGAAVVVAGLYFLTDWINPGNNNSSGSSSNGRGDGSTSGGDSGNTNDITFTLPAGPATLAADYNYDNARDYYSPTDTSSILNKNFSLMNKLAAKYNESTHQYLGGQNYLLMMHGYSPLARGYLGQRTLRNGSTNAPMALTGTDGQALYSFDGLKVQGGAPVNVALVTSNGVNAAVGTSLGEYDETLGRYDFILFALRNGSNISPATNSTIFSKFYNNTIKFGNDSTSISDDTISEDVTRLSNFDLAGYGTVIHNPNASATDNLLAKIVGGRDAGYSNPDYFGFMPNGQMTIFRTGNGSGLIDVENGFEGTYTTLEADGILNLDGLTLTLDVVTDNTDTGGIKTFVAKDGLDTTKNYAGYIGIDNNLYLDSNADGDIDQAYEMDTGILKLTLIKELGAKDYANYDALIGGVQKWLIGDTDYNRLSRPDVLANASVIDGLHSTSAATVQTIMSDLTENNFISTVNSYYDNTGNNVVGTKAADFFRGLGSLGASYSPIVIFSTGAAETDSNWSGETLPATFENAAPLVFDGLNHIFMSVVAVGTTNDTANQSSVSGYTTGGYSLSQWADNSGSDVKYYKSRMCGVAGTGNGGDPWCFAAAGVTDELAVAAAAGAVGAVKSAFNYLNNDQIYVLLALTADGPFLDKSAYQNMTLTNYLRGLYTLPAEYENNNVRNYLDMFQEVFGYGMINLERATTPGKSIHRYDGTNIVSVDGNAYWRAAANTAVHSSSALPMRTATVKTAVYDVLESTDGSMSLPRIWESSFAIGNAGRHALYMGDVLGELKTRRDNGTSTQIGDMSFFMARSERAYNDNMNGLDQLRMSFDMGALHLSADYQHYLIDGASRFSGMANPVLALTSNAITTNVDYDMGKWTFGARAFSGAITDDGLLENDPTLSAQYTPATLGLVNGAESSLGWNNDRFGIKTSFGFMHETNTVLGARTDGLLDLGAGDTQYVDAELRWSPFENVLLKLRGTYARTDTNTDSLFISDVTTIESNAAAIGADIGNFSFAVSMPLAAYNGVARVPYANYAIVENENGIYEIDTTNYGVADLRFGSDKRELRFSGDYRHKFGEFTDGAFGFIYRINPNNTDEFGNESIFMLKMTHRVGI